MWSNFELFKAWLEEWLERVYGLRKRKRLKVRWTVFVNGKISTFKGNFNMDLQIDKPAGFSVSFSDSKGNPARVDGIPVWSITPDGLATLEVGTDGLSATVTPIGALGAAVLKVTADADLGAGVQEISGQADLNFIAGNAVTVTIIQTP